MGLDTIRYTARLSLCSVFGAFFVSHAMNAYLTITALVHAVRRIYPFDRRGEYLPLTIFKPSA